MRRDRAAEHPEIPYDAVDPLKLPDDLYLGEAAGVATNSRETSSSTRGPATRQPRWARAHLLAWRGRALRVRSVRQVHSRDRAGLYGFLFAHAVRVDREDNIWVVDEGSNMVIKFDPDGRVLMTMGRKPEAIRLPPPAPPPRAAPPAAGAAATGAAGHRCARRQLQSPDRCGVGCRRQYLRRRRC